MASLRQILGATAADIQRRITGAGGVPGLPPRGPTTTGFLSSPGSPPTSPPARNWFGPPGTGGGPYGPHWEGPPVRPPGNGPGHVSAAEAFLAAHKGATQTLTHGVGQQLSGLDHDMTKALASEGGQTTMTPVDPIPKHPPNHGPHWIGPAVRPPVIGRFPPHA